VIYKDDILASFKKKYINNYLCIPSSIVPTLTVSSCTTNVITDQYCASSTNVFQSGSPQGLSLCASALTYGV